MLTRATFSHSSCWYKPNPRLARAARPARGHRVTAAAAGGAIPQPVISALKKYGAHAKAAYVLYYQSQDQGRVQNISGADVRALTAKGYSTCTPKDVGDVSGLANCKGVSSMLGYPGNVFDNPTPDLPPSQATTAAQEPAAQQAATFMGCISEATGADGVTELVFAFRGSDGYGDWETNLLGYTGEELYGPGNGRVHEGFYNLLHVGDPNPVQEIDRVLKPYLDAHRADPSRHPLPRVITTGHSLGASLAILAALHVAISAQEYRVDNAADYTKRMLQTYAFAAPRVGNADLGAYMRSDKLQYMPVQVRNVQDAVPYLPPKSYEEAGATAIKLYNREVYTPSAAAAMTAPAPMQLSTAGAAGITAGAPSGSTATLPKPAPVTPASEGIWAWLERLEADLSNAYSMTWEDTPAPSFGVCSIDVKDEGLWGGPFHSLQVYLANLDACTSEAASG